MKKNWQHQKIAIDRYKFREYFGLLFDCGTGKTRTGIRIAFEKYARYGDMHCLVIAPKNLVDQWGDAIEENKEEGDPETSVLLYSAVKKNTKKFQNELDEFLAK